ncbi:MAG: hypothetical protein B6247_25510 [Candidatus Parabeggiatoa sp. nov. 2]|nr:MAG: hypothetical protein B6247_25510 [Beggiatoa sp. 4572_84]
MLEIYKENLSRNSYQNCEFKNINTDEIEIVVIDNNITLKLHVNIKNHVVTGITYSGVIDGLLKNILNHFCDIVINLPILEASNHGVLRLEYLLRASGEKPVDGIISPDNTLPEFKIIQSLIRRGFKNYQAIVKGIPNNNTYIVPSAKVWTKLGDELKIEKLTEVINRHLENINQSSCDYAISIVNSMRIEIVVYKYNDSMETIGSFLLEIEKYIQRELLVPIEIMYAERMDKNRTRTKSRKL